MSAGEPKNEYKGVLAAVLAALLLGSAPILGKLAYSYGVSPLGLAASRTAIAAMALWLAYGLFWRQFTFIFLVGLGECALAGATNGIGSLFYYYGLTMLDASLAQLLYTTYPLFVAVLLRMDGQHLSRLTVARLLLTLVAVYLLATRGASPQALLMQGESSSHLLGVGCLLLSAAFFGFHVVFSQRALYDMPAPTVTLYSLSSMAVTVLVAWAVAALLGIQALVGNDIWALPPLGGILATLGLALFTALSRLTLFVGVKRLGGVQTTLLSVGELMVALILALLLLGEQLTPWQWLGAGLLVLTQLLISREHLTVPMRRPRIDITPPVESVADR